MDTRTPTPCRVCGRIGTRPRGLCWSCFEDEAIRRTVTPQCNRGITSGHGRLPAKPTQALPGSEEKILVLEERAARGEALFHPLDARRSDELKNMPTVLEFLACAQDEPETFDEEIDL